MKQLDNLFLRIASWWHRVGAQERPQLGQHPLRTVTVHGVSSPLEYPPSFAQCRCRQSRSNAARMASVSSASRGGSR